VARYRCDWVTTICLVVRHRVSRFVGRIHDQAAGVRDAFFCPQNDTATRWFQLDTSSLLASDQRKPAETCQIRCRIFRRELPCKTRADRPKGAYETVQVWSFFSRVALTTCRRVRTALFRHAHESRGFAKSNEPLFQPHEMDLFSLITSERILLVWSWSINCHVLI
jgi:hypothetical protein